MYSPNMTANLEAELRTILDYLDQLVVPEDVKEAARLVENYLNQFGE